MKKLLLGLPSIFVSGTILAQVITAPANTNITVTNGLNFPEGRAISVNGTTFFKFSAPATGNVFIGTDAGKVNTGAGNFFLGNQSGINNISGTYNLFIGNSAGASNVTGDGNVALGDGSGNSSKGSSNVFIGRYAGFGSATTNGSENAFIGFASGYNLTTGVGNVGHGRGTGVAITTGSYNTCIGYRADAASGNLNNSVAIGVNALVSASNAIVLGGTGVNAVNVGIGNTAPNNRLEITHGTSGNSGLRLTNLTYNNTASTSASKFLTVNTSGDIVLASYNPGAREAITGSETFWERSGNQLRSSSGASVVIGQQVIKKLPAGYNLYVSDGILTERIKVAVRNSAEWSDYVFNDAYRLKKLEDVALYVKQNKRLPGVPSAETVVKSGIDLGRMDATLLAKIEELTLYIIQQNEMLKKQNTQILHLQKRISSLEAKRNSSTR